jgi:hypothetical protein
MTHKPIEDRNTLILTVLWVTFSILDVFPDYTTTTLAFRVCNISTKIKRQRSYLPLQKGSI